MSAKKAAWTAPGSIEPPTDSAEARKGTAAAHPVLSLSLAPPAGTRRDGSSAGKDGQPDTRTPAEIEADIAQTRVRLAGTLDELSERLSPRAAVRRANSNVRGAFVTPEGSVRKDRAAMVAGGLAAVVGGGVALGLYRRR
jgi:Protein of unknown function (DUF3618)